MAQVVSLCSLGGTDFTIQPQQLLDCTEQEATRLLELGMARELIKGEPTELQLATIGTLTTEENISNETTSTKSSPDAKKSRSRTAKPKAANTNALPAPQITQPSLLEGESQEGTQSSDSNTTEQNLSA